MSTDQGQELLASVIKAHGGLERWNRTEKIQVTFNLHGLLWHIKGWPGTRHPTFTINTHGPPTTLITALDPNSPLDQWKFSAQHVSIESPDGKVLQERSKPRSAFDGHILTTKWDELHFLYFTGYAMSNYLTTPFVFTLPGFEVSQLASHEENGEVWHVLQVVHPDDYPTHSKIQKFYFDSKDFLLRKVDYDVEVSEGAASHYCFDYKSFDGLVIPTLRRAVTRLPDGTVQLAGNTLAGIQHYDVKIFDKDGSVHSEGKWL